MKRIKPRHDITPPQFAMLYSMWWNVTKYIYSSTFQVRYLLYSHTIHMGDSPSPCPAFVVVSESFPWGFSANPEWESRCRHVRTYTWRRKHISTVDLYVMTHTVDLQVNLRTQTASYLPVGPCLPVNLRGKPDTAEWRRGTGLWWFWHQPLLCSRTKMPLPLLI